MIDDATDPPLNPHDTSTRFPVVGVEPKDTEIAPAPWLNACCPATRAYPPLLNGDNAPRKDNAPENDVETARLRPPEEVMAPLRVLRGDLVRAPANDTAADNALSTTRVDANPPANVITPLRVFPGERESEPGVESAALANVFPVFVTREPMNETLALNACIADLLSVPTDDTAAEARVFDVLLA